MGVGQVNIKLPNKYKRFYQQAVRIKKQGLSTASIFEITMKLIRKAEREAKKAERRTNNFKPVRWSL